MTNQLHLFVYSFPALPSAFPTAPTEDQIERMAERAMDAADAVLMSGECSQADYDARARQIHEWAESWHRRRANRPVSAFESARQTFDAAFARFSAIRDQYSARQIGDAEYLDAREVFEAAKAAFDAAADAPPVYQDSYSTHQEAEAYLLAHGFTSGTSVVDGQPIYRKPSKVDDFYGGYARTVLAEIRKHNVAAQYGGGCHFTIRFL